MLVWFFFSNLYEQCTLFCPTQGDFLLKIEPPLGWSFGMIVLSPFLYITT